VNVSAANDHQKPTPIAVSMVLGAILSIQVGAAVATDLFSEVGAAGVVFMRASVSAILLWIIWRPARDIVKQGDRRVVVMFGVVLAGMNLCFYESIDRIPLGIAVTIEFIGPLSVALITSRRKRDWIWVGLAMAGIVLLTGGVGGDDLDVTGLVLAFIAGIFWGTYILLGKRIGEQAEGGSALFVPMLISAILVAPLGIAEGGMDLLDPRVLAFGVFVGALSSAIPFSLELEAMRRLPQSVFGVMMSLEPAVAATVGFVLLSQGMAVTEVIAIALVVAASAGALRSASTPVMDEP
jgi:inner membrane transporter RhtA